MKLGFLKRLVKEDFPPKDQDLISKISFILNPAFEALTNAINGNLNFRENLNTQVRDITVIVNASGNVTNNVSFQSTLKGNCGGMWCIRANDLTTPNLYVSTAPFISWTQKDNQIIINNVTGLIADHKYILRVIATV